MNRYTVAFVLLMTGTFLQGQDSVNQFAWLEGEWKMEGREAYEVWQIANDTLMTGGAFHAEATSFVRDENLSLLYSNGKFVYIPVVFNQNNGKPVEFPLVKYTDKSFTAENPGHDFPQHIVYELTGKNKMHVYITGTKNGKETKSDFYFILTK